MAIAEASDSDVVSLRDTVRFLSSEASSTKAASRLATIAFTDHWT